MTQPEMQAMIDRAFEAVVTRLFGILVTNMERRESGAETKFQRGFEYALRAREIATAHAQQLNKS